jgi:ubiquinone biosynthesis protein UbiJ
MKRYRGLISEISEQRQYDSEALYEMANLFPKHTGLPFVVWMSNKGGAQHDVRVKVSHGPKVLPSEMVSVAIRPHVHVVEGKMSASDLAMLAKWIELNQDVLLKYWEGEIDTKDLVDAIQQINN